MTAAEFIPIFQKLLVIYRKQRAPQCGKNGEFVFRPFNRSKSRADGFDFRAIVKRAAPDEQMRNAARFQSFDIGPCHVLAKADEAAEQQTYVPRLDRHELFRLAR